jgi:hypothetical protein
LHTWLPVYSEQEQGQQQKQLCRQDGGLGYLASQLLIATQTVWILWLGRPLRILGQGDIRKL